jgi:hypothetical protein
MVTEPGRGPVASGVKKIKNVQFFRGGMIPVGQVLGVLPKR